MIPATRPITGPAEHTVRPGRGVSQPLEEPVSLPVPASEPIVIYDRQGADDFAELAQVLAHQGSVTFVYAPTTVTHHHAAPAPAP